MATKKTRGSTSDTSRVVVNLSLNPKIHAKAKRLAKKKGLSLSRLVEIELFRLIATEQILRRIGESQDGGLPPVPSSSFGN